MIELVAFYIWKKRKDKTSKGHFTVITGTAGKKLFLPRWVNMEYRCVHCVFLDEGHKLDLKWPMAY